MKSTNRFYDACDLENDSRLIEEYKQYHAAGKAGRRLRKALKKPVLWMWKFIFN